MSRVPGYWPSDNNYERISRMMYVLAHEVNTDNKNHLFEVIDSDPCRGLVISDRAFCGYTKSNWMMVDWHRANVMCEVCNTYLIMEDLGR